LDAADPTSLASGAELRKLEWRCRRGMKELDLLLVRYLRRRHAGASGDERAAFVEFLELPDPQIARYLVAGDVPDDPRQAELCRFILDSN
jgi:antitoxin CptB